MKLIHCADLHLGSNLTSNLTAEQAQKRNYELFDNFENMLRYAKEEQIQVVLLCGDVFDTKNPPMWVQTACLKLIEIYSDITFFYIRGNHDRGVWEQEWINETLPDNLHLFDTKWSRYECGDIVIYGIECEKDSLYKQALQLVLDETRINIVMLHGRVTENNLVTVAEDVIPISLFQNKNIDYLALGHIHSYEEKNFDQRGKYCYSGCLEGRGFDECGEKGFVLLTVEEEKIKSCFIPFGKRKLFDIGVTIDGCMTTMDISRKIEIELKKSNVSKEDYVRIRLIGNVDVECEKNSMYLQQKWSEQFYYFQIEDDTKLTVDYNDFLYDESLKGEFVRKIRKMDLPEEDKITIIRYGILALSGEEIAECD
ncbi:MAG: metallophosphoesterase [Lachnospiraceae bacterium]|nr:metallophosphoesterase [Lachnospiraceae bacterium]